MLFLSDILPTGYMGAEFCDIQGGDVIAVWGAGPVGQFAAASAKLLGAERVIMIDRFDYRLEIARKNLGVETLNYEDVDSVPEALKELTGGRGPDACIDAVGMEAHHHGAVYAYDRVKQAMRQETERPFALREAIMSVPQRRHRLDHRRLRRTDGQVPDRRADEQGHHDPDGPVPRAPLHAAAAAADHGRRDRPDVHHHAHVCRSATRRRATTSSRTSRTTASRSS